MTRETPRWTIGTHVRIASQIALVADEAKKEHSKLKLKGDLQGSIFEAGRMNACRQIAIQLTKTFSRDNPRFQQGEFLKLARIKPEQVKE